ncbi:MAG: methionine gamma-lyase family protein [Lachnospiraceae bacterium]|nr:methionine gamma-lyase family protein [Lachnospiraceae bacterium]
MNDLYEMYGRCGISKDVYMFGEKVLDGLTDRFVQFDRITEINQLKVLSAMQECRVSEACFMPSSGYGYNDLGRDTLEKVYAKVFHTEDALVRPQLTCGTHALATALFCRLRPGDELLSISGKPYDTLEKVIGIRREKGSLAEYGISYSQVDLKSDGSFDFEGIRAAVKENTKLIAIQRSKGYETRPSLSVDQIGEAIRFVKSLNKDLTVMVDNCYGEFTDTKEPSDVGADMVVGSLIKNPGGGLAPMGGYIAGTASCIEQAAYRLTSPGLGKEVGATLDINRTLFQGLFLSPTVTNASLKGALFAAAIYEKLGFDVIPDSKERRNDIIQAVTLGSAEAVCAFCNGIQKAAPVDSHLTAEPWDMPGYDSKVIMAAGAFISGSSIELSADAPLRPPYAVYFQGGLTWYHAKYGILMSLQALVDKGIVDIYI